MGISSKISRTNELLSARVDGEWLTQWASKNPTKLRLTTVLNGLLKTSFFIPEHILCVLSEPLRICNRCVINTCTWNLTCIWCTWPYKRTRTIQTWWRVVIGYNWNNTNKKRFTRVRKIVICPLYQLDDDILLSHWVDFYHLLYI